MPTDPWKTLGVVMTKARILVVEDDELVAEHIKLLLCEKGYEIAGHALSGEDAIELAKICEPHLLLTDIQLRGKMDGIESAAAIQDMLRIPTLYLTAHSEQYLFERAKITAPFAYLLKPVIPRELELTIEMALYRHDLEQRLRLRGEHLNEAQEIGNIGSWDWDIVNNTLHWTDQIYRIFGLKPQEFGATYEAFMEAVHPDDREMVQNAVTKSLENELSYEIEHRIVRPSGEERIVREKGSAEFGFKKTAVRMQGTVQDVTELRAAERLVEHMAFYDVLTDLPNRNLFFDRLKQSLSQAQRNKQKVAVLFLDLDGFKQVNDSLGHAAGDLMLKGVAERLEQCVRDVDTVARLGGDEFIVILSDVHFEKDAGMVSEKIIAALSDPFELDGQKGKIGCSIGIAVYPEDADNEDALVKAADDAMYAAKNGGKNTYRFFNT